VTPCMNPEPHAAHDWAIAADAGYDGPDVFRCPGVSDCPRCPDGHTPFAGGSHPWNVRVDTDVVRGDGAPTRLIVERSAGAHCAQSDADALYELINGRKP
jgi:hypothetical protein